MDSICSWNVQCAVLERDDILMVFTRLLWTLPFTESSREYDQCVQWTSEWMSSHLIRQCILNKTINYSTPNQALMNWKIKDPIGSYSVPMAFGLFLYPEKSVDSIHTHIHTSLRTSIHASIILLLYIDATTLYSTSLRLAPAEGF